MPEQAEQSLLKRLSNRHLLVLRLYLTGLYTQKQIAGLAGFTEGSISLIVNSPLFQEEVARRRTAIEKEENAEIGNELSMASAMIQNQAVESVAKLTELRDMCPDPAIQLRAADKILSLAYGESVPKGPQANLVVNIETDKLAFLMQVAREAGFVENGDGANKQAEDSSGLARAAESDQAA